MFSDNPKYTFKRKGLNLFYSQPLRIQPYHKWRVNVLFNWTQEPIFDLDRLAWVDPQWVKVDERMAYHRPRNTIQLCSWSDRSSEKRMRLTSDAGCRQGWRQHIPPPCIFDAPPIGYWGMLFARKFDVILPGHADPLWVKPMLISQNLPREDEEKE